MGAGTWALYLGLMLAAAAFVGWLYHRREAPGPGRLVLAALRLGAFALVLLLLFDPALPGGARRTARNRALTLLDASESMALPQRPGAASRWAAAVAEAERRGDPILLFGERARPAPADSLPAEPPGDARTLLLPALVAAAEAGAERVTVVTDAGLEDAALLGGWIARLGLGVEWRRIGEPLPGVALVGADAPEWVRAGEPVALALRLTATGPAPDSVRVVIRQEGRVIGEALAPLPDPGRSSDASVTVRPVAPPEPGFVRLEVALEPGDAVAADDRRAVVLFVSPDPAGVVVISLRPDWETRFLLPVLERALGVPARGYLRTGSEWVRVAAGEEAGRRVAEGDVARTVAAADLVVIHGAEPSAPPWVLDALRTSPRLLLLPGSGPTAGLPLPLALPDAVAADWFAAPAVPPSPVAALIGDVPAAELPPLPALRPADAPAGSWVPLRATRGRRGESAPLLIAGEGGARRWAVALADGYWRWAFPGGEPRQLYDRLWAAVAGWLMREHAAGGSGVRPARRVLSRGAPAAWLTPGLRPDSLRLRLEGEDGTQRDTVLLPSPDDSVRGPALEPDVYRYAATAWGGSQRAEGSGELVVETFSPEFALPAVPLEDIAAARPLGPGPGERTPARPLHTAAWPYALIVLLLAAEWLLRRRWGLR